MSAAKLPAKIWEDRRAQWKEAQLLSKAFEFGREWEQDRERQTAQKDQAL